MSLDQRSPEREQAYGEDRVCGVTFADLSMAAWGIIQNPGFWPAHYKEEHKIRQLHESELAVMLVDLSLFAALNLLRKRQGLEPLTEVPPLVRLAEIAEEVDRCGQE